MSERPAAPGSFSPVTMIALVLVGALSLAGLGVLSAYAPELKSGDDGRAHALSRSSIGFAATVRLLRETGVVVVASRGPLSESAADGLLVLTPERPVSPQQMRNFHHLGPTLIVLPKWSTRPQPVKPGWVQILDILPPGLALRTLPENLLKDTELHHRGKASVIARLSRPNGEPFGVTAQTQHLTTISGPGWIPVIVDETGAAVLAMRQGTGIYVLADPDLLNTLGLKTLGGAQAAAKTLALIRAEGTPVIFDLTLSGFQRSRNLPRLLLEPPLLGVTLCLLAATILAALQAAVRFGPARPGDRAVALGKRALADNTAGLVSLARREHRMAAPYALLARAAAARAIGAPRQLDGAELDGFLDRLGQLGGQPHAYSALAERARTARTPADLMQVARDLYRWRLEMTHERR